MDDKQFDNLIKLMEHVDMLEAADAASKAKNIKDFHITTGGVYIPKKEWEGAKDKKKREDLTKKYKGKYQFNPETKTIELPGKGAKKAPAAGKPAQAQAAAKATAQKTAGEDMGAGDIERSFVKIGDVEVERQVAQDGSVTILLPGDAKIKQPPPPQFKTSGADVFRDKSEITADLFPAGASTYTKIVGVHDVHSGKTKNIPTRTLVDPKSGEYVDVTTEEGRSRAAEICTERLEQASKKIAKATELLETLPKGGERTKVLKWMGEVGELYAYKDLLERGIPTYLLTDSAIKNDIVTVWPCSDQTNSRAIAATQISVKTTKEGGPLNQMGASIKGDLYSAFGNVEEEDSMIMLGKKKNSPSVKASKLSSVAMNLVSNIIGAASDGKVYNPQSSAEGKNAGIIEGGKFMSFPDFVKGKKITTKEVSGFIKQIKDQISGGASLRMSEDLNGDKIKSEEMLAILDHMDERLKKLKNPTLMDLIEWSKDFTSELLDITKAEAGAGTDTMGTFYRLGEGLDSMSTGIITMEDQDQKFEKLLGKSKTSFTSDEILEKIMGHFMRFRAVDGSDGDKKSKRGSPGGKIRADHSGKIAASFQAKPIDINKYSELVKGSCKTKTAATPKKGKGKK